MRYLSSRGQTNPLSFKDAVMTGLAKDGGLLVPESIPDVSGQLRQWQGSDYAQLAQNIIQLYADDLDRAELEILLQRAYGTFRSPEVTPLVKLGDLHVLELFHGPTLAFKDVALQFLGNLFESILNERGESLNILGATSGDTGSAAIAGVRGRQNINIFIMFPEGKTSPIQEQQMTSVLDDNVHNIGILGSFDDCQAILKNVFADLPFRDEYHLGAVNSVNWARVLAQIVYYFSAWYQLNMPASFDVCVPTGNFGNIFAGYLAKRMGLPIERLILATNRNDILSDFFNRGVYARGEVAFTHSPAMDIQVASNFERYLYYRFDGSAEKVREFMGAFASTGRAEVKFNTAQVDSLFSAGSVSDEDTLRSIQATYAEYGYLLDPHTAVGVHLARSRLTGDRPMVCMATAHPAKFPEVIRLALPDVTVEHELLSHLSGIQTRKTILDADDEQVKNLIRERQ